MVRPNLWTPEAIEALKQGLREQMSGGQIAIDLTRRFGRGEFGFSRSGVLSKVKRLGLTMARRRGRPVATSYANHGKKLNGKKLSGRIRLGGNSQLYEIKPPRSITEPTPEKTGSLVSFEELAAGHCRWPHGSDPRTMLYCGKPNIGPTGLFASYCPLHAQMAFAPRRIEIDGH